MSPRQWRKSARSSHGLRSRAPRRSAARLPHTPGSSRYPPRRKRRASLEMDVLIVDDETKMRTLLQTILEEEGHRCRNASGGEEAISLLEDAYFDVVVTDLKMEPPGAGHPGPGAGIPRQVRPWKG